MMVCRADKLFFSADQVLAKISPNVSVSAIDPEGDPLGQYLRSLDALSGSIDRDVLVLPGTICRSRDCTPHRRIDRTPSLALRPHPARLLPEPRSAAELVPFVFTRRLDPHQMGFAFGEVLAHVNYMLRRGKLKPIDTADGIQRTAAA